MITVKVFGNNTTDEPGFSVERFSFSGKTIGLNSCFFCNKESIKKYKDEEKPITKMLTENGRIRDFTVKDINLRFVSLNNNNLKEIEEKSEKEMFKLILEFLDSPGEEKSYVCRN